MSGHQLKYHATSVTRDLQVQNRAKIESQNHSKACQDMLYLVLRE